MAITFEDEEKHSSVGTFIGIFFLLAAVGAGGFFGIRYLLSRQQAIIPAPSAAIQLNKEIMSDPRLDSLELMEEIVPGEDPVGRDNPFTQPSAEARAAVAKANSSAGGEKSADATVGTADAGADGLSPVKPGTLSPVLKK